MTTETKPHAEDMKTIYQLEVLAPTRTMRETIEDAYQLGRCRGRVEGAEALRAATGIAS
jgi:hypothetical protein